MFLVRNLWSNRVDSFLGINLFIKIAFELKLYLPGLLYQSLRKASTYVLHKEPLDQGSILNPRRSDLRNKTKWSVKKSWHLKAPFAVKRILSIFCTLTNRIMSSHHLQLSCRPSACTHKLYFWKLEPTRRQHTFTPKNCVVGYSSRKSIMTFWKVKDDCPDDSLPWHSALGNRPNTT